MPKIRDLPAKERPREIMFAKGAAMLTDSQLLSVIISSGSKGSDNDALSVAAKLLETFGSLKEIDGASISELCRITGIGIAKAVRIKGAFELGKRLLSSKNGAMSCFRSSEEVAQHFIPLLCNVKKEQFYALLLDGKNRLIKSVLVSEGSLTSSIVHPREAFVAAVKESAASVIFLHNHPSGDPSPSLEDTQVTERLVRCGDILGIRVLDHIIIGASCFFSFCDRGLIRQT